MKKRKILYNFKNFKIVSGSRKPGFVYRKQSKRLHSFRITQTSKNGIVESYAIPNNNYVGFLSKFQKRFHFSLIDGNIKSFANR